MNLEDQLRQALAREAAPGDFKDRVMARIAEQRSPWWQPWGWPGEKTLRMVLPLAAALLAGAVIPSVIVERQRAEHERAIEARNQLITALSVTKTKLRHTREMIRRTSRRAS